MKPEMGLLIFLERHSQSPAEGSVDASSQYIVTSMTYSVGYFPFCKYFLISELFIFPKDESEEKWKHQLKTEQDRKKLRNGYGPKKYITARVHPEMSRYKYYRNVRFVKIVHN